MSKINPSNFQIVRRKSVFLSSLIILLAVIGGFVFSAYFKASGQVTSEQQNVSSTSDSAKEKTAPSCCSQPSTASAESHTLVGSYFSLKENQETTLMFNNKGPQPLVVSPIFFSLSGEKLEMPALTIPRSEEHT